MEDQFNFIQKQLDNTNEKVNELISYTKFMMKGDESDYNRFVGIRLNDITVVLSAQQALLESMFNLLRSTVK